MKASSVVILMARSPKPGSAKLLSVFVGLGWQRFIGAFEPIRDVAARRTQQPSSGENLTPDSHVTQHKSRFFAFFIQEFGI
jgi:hypothetical protein